MKWIIALIASVAMFYIGYHHASRYEADETKQTKEETAESKTEAVESAAPAS